VKILDHEENLYQINKVLKFICYNIIPLYFAIIFITYRMLNANIMDVIPKIVGILIKVSVTDDEQLKYTNSLFVLS